MPTEPVSSWRWLQRKVLGASSSPRRARSMAIHESFRFPISADSGYTSSVNANGTRVVLEVAAAEGVGRVVFTSSREVYGDPRELPVSDLRRFRVYIQRECQRNPCRPGGGCSGRCWARRLHLVARGLWRSTRASGFRSPQIPGIHPA